MQEPKKYEEVEWAHIVPAGYLRNFATGEMIVKHELESGRARERPVKKVGTRRRAYSRTRPATGERIDDVEWALRQLENKVQVIRYAEKRFPFSELDRSIIAQFAGTQHVRVPKWKRRHEALVDELKEEMETQGLGGFSPIANQILKGRLVKGVEAQGTDTARLVDMQRWLYAESAFFYAMHWTLIRFHRPALITCDHPVVLWPGTEARELGPGDGTGLRNVVEVRYPLTAQLCLLMTWRSGPDAPEMINGNREMALNINGFTRAESELEWFSIPGSSPPMPSDRSRLLPLSTAIYSDYDLRSVEQSPRRSQAIQLTQKTARQPLVAQPTFPALKAGTAD
ncbi:MAG TPA: DUF4238 domain-containing protein [Solirubrobacterales bacterium]